MTWIKWALFAGSMFALLKLGLARRAGSILRAMLSRFGVLVFALLALSLPVLGPQNGVRRETAHAAGCSKIIPVDALAGSVFGAGASGALVSGIGLNTAVSPLVGGAAPVAATAGVGVLGTVGLAAGAFIGAFYGTCKFLEWASGDGASGDSLPFFSHTGVTYGPLEPCTTTYGQSAVPVDSGQTVLASDYCRVITYPSSQPAGVTYYLNNFTSGTYNTTGGVTVQPLAAGPGPYTMCSNPAICATPFAGMTTTDSRFKTAAGWTAGTATSPFSSSIGTKLIQRWPCTYNFGGYCGLDPRLTVTSRDYAAGTGGTWVSILNVVPEAKVTGWRRYLITDAYCYGSGWVRATSEAYWDKSVSPRIPVPSCPAGQMVTAIRVWRVPTWNVGGAICAVGAVTCWHSGAAVFQWAAPASWTAGGAPNFVPCMAVDADCGTPVLDTAPTPDVCAWGGHAVALTFCDPSTQAGVVPGTLPKENPTVVPAPYVAGEVVYTNEGTEVGEGGPSTTTPGTGGVTVDVAIDEGDGRRCYVAGSGNPTTTTGATTTTSGATTTTLPATTTTSGATTTTSTDEEVPCEGTYADGGDDPCLPTGWGWMNPIEWVLKPVKCALIWAFVPDAEVVQDAWDGLLEDAHDNAPIAWAYKAHELVSDASDGMQTAVAASSDECITVIPDGGGLTDSPAGEVCPSAMGYTTLEAARPWLGYAVWLMWAWTMYGALFRKAPASTEPQQLSLF